METLESRSGETTVTCALHAAVIACHCSMAVVCDTRMRLVTLIIHAYFTSQLRLNADRIQIDKLSKQLMLNILLPRVLIIQNSKLRCGFLTADAILRSQTAVGWLSCCMLL